MSDEATRRRNLTMGWTISAFSVLVLVLGLMLVVPWLSDIWGRWADFNRESIVTEAEIVEKDTQLGGRSVQQYFVTYQFAAQLGSGGSLTLTQTAQVSRTVFDALDLGQVSPLRYIPARPEEAYLPGTEPQLATSLVGIASVALFVALDLMILTIGVVTLRDALSSNNDQADPADEIPSQLEDSNYRVQVTDELLRSKLNQAIGSGSSLARWMVRIDDDLYLDFRSLTSPSARRKALNLTRAYLQTANPAQVDQLLDRLAQLPTD
ncbi:MAG: hypothetical protein GYB68_01885 [Chloroflexi bacterium]|nr:hypothetical protein [Chloroflexota bacterium]